MHTLENTVPYGFIGHFPCKCNGKISILKKFSIPNLSSGTCKSQKGSSCTHVFENPYYQPDLLPRCYTSLFINMALGCFDFYCFISPCCQHLFKQLLCSISQHLTTTPKRGGIKGDPKRVKFTAIV